MAQAIYIRKDGVRGTLVDSTGAVRGGLQFSVTLGMAAEIAIKIYDGEKDAFLTQTELARYAAFNFVLADDFNQTTDPQIRVNTGITVGADGAINVTIPNTNTEGLATWLGQKAQDTIGVELACYEAGEETPTMVLQWTCVVYNRRDLEGGEPTAPIDPEYLTAAQVYALMSAGVEMQFSADGTNWHTTQVLGDVYVRFRSSGVDGAEWSQAISIDTSSVYAFSDIISSTAASLTASPAQSIIWTPSGDGVLSVSGGVAGQRSYATIDIVLGASNTVTLNGLTFATEKDALKSSYTNHCVIVFTGTSATLAVCEPADATQITVDDALSPTSLNPVANSTLYNALNGKSPAPIVASTAPTTSTEGAVGQLYVDTATSKTYHCTGSTTANDTTTYAWVDDINAKGGTVNGLLRITQKGLICGNAGSIDSGNGQNLVVGNANVKNFDGGSWGATLVVGRDVTVSEYTFPHLVVGKALTIDTGFGEDSIITAGYNEIKFQTYKNGNLYIVGGYQQKVVEIPTATTAYTLEEGCFSHVPSSAPTYTLPDYAMRIISNAQIWTRTPSADGTGYYGWKSGNTTRYTASATPSVGNNTYTNTALTAGAKAITEIRRRTHEIVLTVRFSSTALSCAFQDAAGNTLTPLPLAGTIADGSVVCYRCTWEELLGRWVIMPVMLGTYSAGV